MKPIRDKVLRIIVAIVAVAFLLYPAWLMAIVWTKVNLIVTLSMILITFAVAIWLPGWKWLSAAASSLLIAIPPYPYWVFSNEVRGYYLHFFYGYTLENIPAGTFAFVFVLSLLLFAAIFWAIGSRRKVRE